MASLVKTIFLTENEKNIFKALKNQGIDTKVFEYKLADLFNRVYNNFVGYYIFKQDDIVYKLIVLPKTINKNSQTAEKDFVNYLLHYHRVNSKYKFDETRQISDSLLSLAFEDNNQDENTSHLPIDEFEFYKYKAILERIEKFFKKHKNYKRINIDYKSQGIKYKLNLAKNIKELDKTTIHQTQTIDMMYSTIATITYNALKIFISKRLKNIDDKYKNELLSYTKKTNSFISKKYTIDKNYKLTLSKLNNFKITKVFNKKSDTKQLLVDIKSLFGFEQMYNDNLKSVSNRYDLTTTSFFIDPILFYEWYVYDILKKFADDKKYKILFDKDKENKTTIKYDLTSLKYNKDNDRSSNPDYILIDEEKNIKIVLDAKWKNITKLGDIKSNDFLKLQHDALLLSDNEYKTIPYLIYPNYLSSEDNIKISKDDRQYFNFGILQIDMNFNKKENNINFKYDYEEIEKQIDKEEKANIINSTSEQLIDEIDTNRTEIITELLNQETLEKKENILNKLDNNLLESAEKLNGKIEENISKEVNDILEKYDDILEDDSKKFLKSSSSIYNYYKDKNYEHFDYSMPGSGLWKLVELELNTSFSWFLRILSNVCDNSCPWTNISNTRRSITQDLANGKRVKLNQYEHNDNNRLQGLMLGGINLLLQDNSTIAEFNEITNLDRNFFVDELIVFIIKIIDLRNEHAHIKAMSLDKFEELNGLIFDSDDNLSNIEKILKMKKQIKEYI